MTYRSIRMPWEAWIYLREIMHQQRSPGKPPLSEGFVVRAKREFDSVFKSGWRDCCNGDLGGVKDGKWVGWTIEEMACMLDEAGLKYEWSTCERIYL